MAIAAALKLVAGHPQVDPLTGVVTTDERLAGCSPADDAALEWALRLGERWDEPVVALTSGPAAADRVLRRALAAGAARALRIEGDAQTPSTVVARSLAVAAAEVGATVVLCGDVSLDRGSGAVPATLAHLLGAQQALGLVELTAGLPGEVTALRRLDRGRREELAVTAPAVLSVEGSLARLRRAALRAEIAAARATLEVLPAPAGPTEPPPTPAGRVQPYRPPTRVQPPPTGPDALERIRTLTAASASRTPPRSVEVGAEEAAEILLDQLVAWGEWEPTPGGDAGGDAAAAGATPADG